MIDVLFTFALNFWMLANNLWICAFSDFKNYKRIILCLNITISFPLKQDIILIIKAISHFIYIFLIILLLKFSFKMRFITFCHFIFNYNFFFTNTFRSIFISSDVIFDAYVYVLSRLINIYCLI